MVDIVLYTSALRTLARPGRLIWSVLLALAAPLLAILVKHASSASHHPVLDPYEHSLHLYNAFSSLMIFGFVLVILSVLSSTGIILQEVEQKTIVYLLTRPVARWRILLARYFASITLTTAVAWGSTVLLALGTLGIGGFTQAPVGRDMGVLLLGAFAYTSLFLLLCSMVNRALIPLVAGLLYGFLWETLIPQLPGNFRAISLMSYIHVLAPHHVNKANTDTSGSLLGFGGTSGSGFHITTALSWGVLCSVAAGCLVLAILVFSSREYVGRAEGG